MRQAPCPPQSIRGAEPGPLLVPVDQFGVFTIRRLCDQTMYEVCKRLSVRAGVAAFGPHDLRRTFAGDMLDAGADVALAGLLAEDNRVFCNGARSG